MFSGPPKSQPPAPPSSRVKLWFDFPPDFSKTRNVSPLLFISCLETFIFLPKSQLDFSPSVRFYPPVYLKLLEGRNWALWSYSGFVTTEEIQK